MQLVIHQRHGDFEVADLDLGRLEGGVTILGPKMAFESKPDIFSGNVGQKLSFRNIAFKIYLVILDAGLACAEIAR